MPEAAAAVGVAPVEAPAIEVLRGGAEAYPRMLAAIAQAQVAIELEVYTWRLDETGRQFVRAVSAAARRGVRVLVRIDGVGSWFAGWCIEQQLRAAGASVQVFHPLRAVFRGRIGRDHRKILVVDRSLAFIGGVNIADEYALRVGAREWADLVLQLRGPLAAALSEVVNGHRVPVRDHATRLFFSSWGGGHRLRRRYLKALGSAHSRIQLAHAYFLPDRRLRRSLTAAARRGVRVELLVPGENDVPFMRSAMRSHYRSLLRAGVIVRETRGQMLHAKAALIDDSRLLVGSFNLDPLSLENGETLAEVRDRAAIDSVREWFAALVAQSAPVDGVESTWDRIAAAALEEMLGAVVSLMRWERRLRVNQRRTTGR